jgi:hypothetical protein
MVVRIEALRLHTRRQVRQLLGGVLKRVKLGDAPDFQIDEQSIARRWNRLPWPDLVV